MKYLIWLLRAAFFFFLFAFSLKNQHTVTVHGFWGMQWSGPLVLAMLVAFALGLALGLATIIPSWRRNRVIDVPLSPSPSVPASTEGAGQRPTD